MPYKIEAQRKIFMPTKEIRKTRYWGKRIG